MLHRAPVLRFFSAWTAAVKVNNLDKTVGEQRARDMLSYIAKYVNYYHPSLTPYILYQMDNANTYDPQFLADIADIFVSTCQDTTVMQDLCNRATRHGSSKDGSVKYASMHLIMFKDIIDKNYAHALFHPLNTDKSNDDLTASVSLPDCIISIGGSAEKRFGEVRHLVRQVFNDPTTSTNNQAFYHYPLSVRMLSRAGQTPVYYRHETHEITVDTVLNGVMTDLNQADEAATTVSNDLRILKEDIGMSILKPFVKLFRDPRVSDISSWKSVVKTLIEQYLLRWRTLRYQCLTENTPAIGEIFEHWPILNDFNDDACLILQRIVIALEAYNNCLFGHLPPPSTRIICAGKDTEKIIMNELDNVLRQILVTFVKNRSLSEHV
jgi:hypothetical protein